MSIRIGLCRFFLFIFLYCFGFLFGLCCFVELEDWEGMGWKVGRVRGWQGEVVYYWQNGGGGCNLEEEGGE